MTLGLFHYQVLSDILEKIHYIYREEDLSRVILEKLSRSLDVEAGTIFTVTGGEITPSAAHGASLDLLKAIGFSKNRGVVGWVAQYGQAVKVDSPQDDARFMGSADAATGFKTRNIIASPIVAKGKVVGVLEFINKKEGVFTIPDLELLSMIGRELGIAFENARLIRELTDSHTWLKGVVEGLGAALLVTDREGRVAVANARAKALLCVAPSLDLLDKPPLALAAEKAPEFLALMLEAAAAGKPVQRAQVRGRFGDRELTVGYSAAPFAGQDGQPAGMTFLFQDITAYATKEPK